MTESDKIPEERTFPHANPAETRGTVLRELARAFTIFAVVALSGVAVYYQKEIHAFFASLQ